MPVAPDTLAIDAPAPRPVAEQEAPDVSIIIVNWNTRQLLARCLQTLERRTGSCSREVVVVDNASNDGSADMVASSFPSVHLIRNQRNEGFARACNQGLEAGRGRHLLLLNSDTRDEQDAVTSLVAFMDGHPDTGAAGCMFTYPDGRRQPSCARFPRAADRMIGLLNVRNAIRSLTDRKRFFPRPFYSWDEHEVEREVDWIVGACLIVRREVLAGAGVLDDGIFLFAEDLEWCYRIKLAGWKIRYTPAARLVHVESGSWTTSSVRRGLAILCSLQYFYRKHYGPWYARAMKAARTIGALLQLPLWGLLLLVCLPSGSRRRTCLRHLRWCLYCVAWGFSLRPQGLLRAEDVPAPAGIAAESAP